jgi:hypothetical protein
MKDDFINQVKDKNKEFEEKHNNNHQ